MVLAAGNVTRTMPCASPAALIIVRSVFEAIWPSRQLSPQVSLLGPITRYRSLPTGPGAAIPPGSMRKHSGWLPQEIDGPGDHQSQDEERTQPDPDRTSPALTRRQQADARF
jgi:hypothetical protein